MNFQLQQAIEVLERTPQALEQLLSGLSVGWLQRSEGEGTWNVTEVMEHLIEAEKMNWIPRLEFMLSEGDKKSFPDFDRYSHLKEKSERTIEQSLQHFKELRTQNIAKLKELVSSESQLEVTGIHPAFGAVKVRELISTWVVHDFTHTAQIVRVLADRYRSDVGPWIQYLSVLKKR
jgi:uncharacterized damage-inducible protein DinB